MERKQPLPVMSLDTSALEKALELARKQLQKTQEHLSRAEEESDYLTQEKEVLQAMLQYQTATAERKECLNGLFQWDDDYQALSIFEDVTETAESRLTSVERQLHTAQDIKHRHQKAIERIEEDIDLLTRVSGFTFRSRNAELAVSEWRLP